MSDKAQVVIGGVDTHKDIHVAAVISPVGSVLSTSSFPSTPKGFRDILAWMRSFGEPVKVGVEGTGSYGAGLARFLASQGIVIVEVNRPNRRARRAKGKSDTVDAQGAALSALNGQAQAVPKTGDGIIEAIRVLRVAYCSARQTRTRISNQIRDLIVTAPDKLRGTLGPLGTEERVWRCGLLRPSSDIANPTQATRIALKSLAQQYKFLTQEMAELYSHLDVLTAKANPGLRGAKGLGVDTAAILLTCAGDNPERMRTQAGFAALCGASPVEASSGKVIRHRLNRGGNRQANHALWRIAMVRMTCHDATKQYVAKRKAQGKSDREIMRCVKRYIAREVYRLLTHPQVVPDGRDLRIARIAKGLTLTYVAKTLGVSVTELSRIERAITHNSEFAIGYQSWLKTIQPAKIPSQSEVLAA